MTTEIKIGKYHSIESTTIQGIKYLLMEHDTFGDEDMCFAFADGEVFCLDDEGYLITAYNGFDDLTYYVENFGTPKKRIN